MRVLVSIAELYLPTRFMGTYPPALATSYRGLTISANPRIQSLWCPAVPWSSLICLFVIGIAIPKVASLAWTESSFLLGGQTPGIELSGCRVVPSLQTQHPSISRVLDSPSVASSWSISFMPQSISYPHIAEVQPGRK